MNQFKLVTSIFVSASLLSSAIFAHGSLKDEAIPESYNWTGFYVGPNAGVVKHTLNITDDQATTFYATIQQVSNPKSTGGFQVGYRRQLNLTQASGVYGLEFSANFANARSKKEYGSPYALYQLNFEDKLKSLCLVQLMGGIAADKTLLFLAAGISWTDITGRVTNMDSIPFFDSFNINKKMLGTAVSAGIEYAFSERVSARIKVDYILPDSYASFDDVGDDFQISNNIVQGTIGINYKFG